MTFVPVFIPPPQPSARSVELGQRIAQLVREYRAQTSGLRGDEVSQAFSIARGLLRSEQGGSAATFLGAGVAAALLLAGLVAFLLYRGGGSVPLWPILAAIGGLAAIFLAMKTANR